MDSRWNAEIGILRTQLQGSVTASDVEAWRAGLERALAQVPDGGRFKLFVNLHGYEPADLDTHKAMRTVIPELPARHGMRPAVIDLFEGAQEPVITTERGVRCIAFERFFSELEAAEELVGATVNGAQGRN